MVWMRHKAPLKERALKTLRDFKLQQKDLAAEAGVSEATISNLFRGRDPLYTTGLKIEDALTRIEARKAS